MPLLDEGYGDSALMQSSLVSTIVSSYDFDGAKFRGRALRRQLWIRGRRFLWSYSLVARVLHVTCRIAVIFLPAVNVCMADDQKPDTAIGRTHEKKSDYIVLSAAEGARFLVGNSVIVLRSEFDQANANSQDEIYYFHSDQSMYVCGRAIESQCFLRPWSIKNDEICLLQPGECRPFRVLKSAKSDEFANSNGRIGRFVEYGRVTHEIVRGNWTDVPQFDPRAQARRIELSDGDLAKLAGSGSRAGLDQHGVMLVDSAPLMVGNTYMSEDQPVKGAGQGANRCPVHGRYYAPDGRVVDFSCDAWPDHWTIGFLHWRMISSLFCTDDATDPGVLTCGAEVVLATPVSGPGSAKMLVREDGDKLVGYAGNVFNFHFEDHQNFKRPTEK
ncbi:MAG: hypothetical protein P4M07_28015 [Xanthobacteraceae bacterium]|nr:hypothetical protein [Xanthobacteraceae bacterium]